MVTENEKQIKVHCSNTQMNRLLRYVFTNEGNEAPVDGKDLDTKGITYSFDERLSLPHRSTYGNDYPGSLKELFACYQTKLKDGVDLYRDKTTHSSKRNTSGKSLVPLEPVNELCEGILSVLKEYHRGLPASAFDLFSNLLNAVNLKDHQIPMVSLGRNKMHPDHLFRIRHIDDGLAHSRKDIFHPDFSFRHIIGTNRYSIAGYPTLYLADNLELALNESGAQEGHIVSCYKFVKGFREGIIDFGLRPRDFSFIENGKECSSGQAPRTITFRDARRYLIWFPLIAACSFVRAHPGNPYADEYILPQLLMQWIRTQSVAPDSELADDVPSSLNASTEPLPTLSERDNEITLSSEDIDTIFNSIFKENGAYSSTLSITDLINLFVLEDERISDYFDSIDLSSNILSRTELRSLQAIYNGASHLERFTQEMARRVSDRRSRIDVIDRELGIDRLQKSKDRLETCRKTLIEFLQSIKGHLDGSDGSKTIEIKVPNDDHAAFVIEAIWAISRSCTHLYNTRVNLNWLINLPTHFIGIRYFSCKNDVAPTLGTNYAFPMEPIMVDGCEVSSLNNFFEWTSPVNMADYPKLDECKRHLLELASRSINLGNCIS